MKTTEELNVLKNESETMKIKLAALSEKELSQVSGGSADSVQFYNADRGFDFIKPDGGSRDTFAKHS